jgi:hypothetical protein
MSTTSHGCERSQTKITSSAPPLTAVRTAYATPPFLPFFHPHQSSWPAFAHVAVSCGLIKTDPEWSEKLDAALTATRCDDLQRGTNAA